VDRVTKVRSVTILGSTGSVGRSTLDLIGRSPDQFRIMALTAHRDVAGLAELARTHRAEQAVIGDPSLYQDLVDALDGSGIEAFAGEAEVEAAAGAGADWTMAAIVGTAGLKPVMRALQEGGTVAFANKEALVSAGALMTAAASRHEATLLPVDSEHNAIFQCFDRSQAEKVSRIILTASGGPFLDRSIEEMRGVSAAEAVAHPNWSMGAKISVDSATMMNKGLELIEAFHLFPLPPESIEVVVHPQSVIHSLVEYVDGSVLAQLGAPDMRIPIAYCLSWPERMHTPCERLDLVRIGSLDFRPPDMERFPALRLAREALEAGGARPAILNAANEIAVGCFLESRIGFLDIAAMVGEVLSRYDPPAPSTIDDVLEIDREARNLAMTAAGKFED
jgi:1-deoxy-D-xylulose-5-phosphate reductoisomerase